MNAVIRGNAWPDAYGESLGLVIIRKACDYRCRDIGFRIAMGKDRFRVNRSGSWLHNAGYCRSADRSHYTPTGHNYDMGFRIARRIS